MCVCVMYIYIYTFWSHVLENLTYLFGAICQLIAPFWLVVFLQVSFIPLEGAEQPPVGGLPKL